MESPNEVVVDGRRISLDEAFAEASRRCQRGDIAGGERIYRLIKTAWPDNARSAHALGFVAMHTGRNAEAISLIQEAVALKPDFADAYGNLGTVLFHEGKTGEAIDVFRKAVELVPDDARQLCNLGIALKKQGEYWEAERVLRHSCSADPGYAKGHSVLAALLREQCRLDESLEHYREALRIEPNPATHSDMLLLMNYIPSFTIEDIYCASRVWEETCGVRGVQAALPFTPSAIIPDPDRRLRIGYVSADFRSHPVGFFLAPVLASHDRNEVEVYCYSGTLVEDELTERLRSHAHCWRPTAGVSDDELIRTIRNDSIDILIDLSGHTGGNRLPVFAARPAPVLATWAGYVGTTGLSTMDYLISDWRESPEGSDCWYVEKVERLPDGYVCFEPPLHAPPVAPLPARSRGGVTFGCFNNLAKINPQVVALWAEILKQVPGSRMLMVTPALGDPPTGERYRDMFRAGGFEGQVVLSGKKSNVELLALYSQVDIALDPFPYSGGVTTLESLWMGVPVVTLGGDRFCALHSVSHLTTVGVPEMIAAGRDAYIDIAVALAHDLGRLEKLRRELRPMMASSPICNGTLFTRNLEALLRKIWRRWCEDRDGVTAGVPDGEFGRFIP